MKSYLTDFFLSSFRDTDRSNSIHMDEIVIPQDREAVEVGLKVGK